MTSILKASKKKALKPSPLTSQPQPITTAKDSKASLKPNATKKKAVRVVDENEDSQVDDAAVKKAKAKKEAKGKEKEDVKKVESETKGSERAKVEAAEVKKPTKKRKGEDDVAAKADTKKRKNTKKAPSPSPSVSSATGSGLEEAEAEETEDEEEEEVMLKGFSSESGSDSSDEDDDADKAPPLDVSKLPTIAKDDATVKRKLEKAKKQPTEERGVLYLGRIPHGFYESEMRSYFSQFGDVTRLRLSRNRVTGASKHYAFIEFASSAVAEIVAETMDNYLLMGHILRCKVVKKEDVHPKLWIGANRVFRKVPKGRIARIQHNKVRTEEERKKVEKRLKKRESRKRKKIAEAGIEYDFGPASYVKKP